MRAFRICLHVGLSSYGWIIKVSELQRVYKFLQLVKLEKGGVSYFCSIGVGLRKIVGNLGAIIVVG